MNGISRVFIANRGEIAIRIIAACHDLGIETVLGVSEVERESLAARKADRVICIGPPHPAESYLKVHTVIKAAIGTGCNAIHPGYGFLSERPEMGESCLEHGLVFIGPTPENIRKMGDKLLAREIVGKLGIPLIPGSGLVNDFKEIDLEEIEFPILLKAAAGGGGKGMKIVERSADLKRMFEEASAEARSAFGDDRMYAEHFIANARHVEVQILADRHGTTLHLFDRDCSLQRRFQKVVEEAPAVGIPDEIRNRIRSAAITIAKHIGYESVGTIETIFDEDKGRFYFLEMNTRIQVEHPVTEMVTGINLVREQIKIANGDRLDFDQENVRVRGHAMECRINAETTEKNFQPCPGKIVAWKIPGGPNTRVDTHCFSGYLVTPYYDSLLAKLITHGSDRAEALARMRSALEEFIVTGIHTNIQFLSDVMAHPDFIGGHINTRWLENLTTRMESNS